MVAIRGLSIYIFSAAYDYLFSLCHDLEINEYVSKFAFDNNYVTHLQMIQKWIKIIPLIISIHLQKREALKSFCYFNCHLYLRFFFHLNILPRHRKRWIVGRRGCSKQLNMAIVASSQRYSWPCSVHKAKIAFSWTFSHQVRAKWSNFIRYITKLTILLYLADLTPHEKLPVIFYIHGGGFIEGSGNGYAPDFLIEKDVILVGYAFCISNNRCCCSTMNM